MLYIIAGKDGRPSMKGVYENMKSNAELRIRRWIKGKNPYVRRYVNLDASNYIKSSISLLNLDNQKVIRWGSRIGNFSGGIVYNTNTALALASDKKKSREVFMQKGVNCPKLLDLSNKTFPVIARPSHHAKGKNFIVLKNYPDFSAHYKVNEPKGWYYSQFIDKNREFRVHCGSNKVLECLEKKSGGDKIAWNLAVTGESFSLMLQQDYIYPVVFEALKACEALGLTFSGVDVMLKGNVAYVLEGNCAPTLASSPTVSKKYALYFDWLNRKDTKRKPWEYKNFKQAKSLAWKIPQLLDQTTIIEQK